MSLALSTTKKEISSKTQNLLKSSSKCSSSRSISCSCMDFSRKSRRWRTAGSSWFTLLPNLRIIDWKQIDRRLRDPFPLNCQMECAAMMSCLSSSPCWEWLILRHLLQLKRSFSLGSCMVWNEARFTNGGISFVHKVFSSIKYNLRKFCSPPCLQIFYFRWNREKLVHRSIIRRFARLRAD